MITDLDIPQGVNALTIFEEIEGTQMPAQTIKLSENSRSVKLEVVDWGEVERHEEIRRIEHQG